MKCMVVVLFQVITMKRNEVEISCFFGDSGVSCDVFLETDL